MCIGISAALSEDGGGDEGKHEDTSWMGPPEVQALVEEIPRMYSDLRWVRASVCFACPWSSLQHEGLIVNKCVLRGSGTSIGHDTWLPGLHALSLHQMPVRGYKTCVYPFAAFSPHMPCSVSDVQTCMHPLSRPDRQGTHKTSALPPPPPLSPVFAGM